MYVGESNEEFVCSDADMEKELNYLKEKCDAGGEVIITQLFYDYDVFKGWVNAVRAKGITAPILPGIMPLNAYKGFKNMTGDSAAIAPASQCLAHRVHLALPCDRYIPSLSLSLLLLHSPPTPAFSSKQISANYK